MDIPVPLHALFPATSVYLPGPHGVQLACAAAAWYWPVAQSWQDPLWNLVPAAHEPWVTWSQHTARSACWVTSHVAAAQYELATPLLAV